MTFAITSLFDTKEYTFATTTTHLVRVNKATKEVSFVTATLPDPPAADDAGAATATPSAATVAIAATVSDSQVPFRPAGEGKGASVGVVSVGGGFGETAVVGVDRRVALVSDNGATVTVHEAEFERRISALAFGSTADDMIVGLRHGGLHAGSPANPDYGHLAVVTALARTDSYVVSGDRDGLIRIAHASAIFDVAAFALGHTHWVSALATLPGRRFVSAAGDGTIRLWDLDRLPKAVSTITFSGDSAVKSYVSSLLYLRGDSTLVAVVVNVTEGSSRLLRLRYDAAAGTLAEDATVASPVAHPLCVAAVAGSDSAYLVGGRDGQLAQVGEETVYPTVVTALAGEGTEHDVAWLFRSDRDREGTVAAGDEDLLSADAAAAKRAKMAA